MDRLIEQAGVSIPLMTFVAHPTGPQISLFLVEEEALSTGVKQESDLAEDNDFSLVITLASVGSSGKFTARSQMVAS